MPPEKLVVIGGSAGSLDVLLQLIPDLNPSLQCAIVIVLHRKNSFDTMLVDLLATKTSIAVKEADDKELIENQNIYLACPDYHLLIEQDKSFSLDSSEKINFSRPSIDVTLEAAAEVFKKNTTGILLSGANNDGVHGLRTIKYFNGVTIAQDPLTADMPFMPLQAIENNAADKILSPLQISSYINNLK